MDRYRKLKTEHTSVCNELQICKRKLDSKCEALLILSRELEQCRSDKDRLKVITEQIRHSQQRHLQRQSSSGKDEQRICYNDIRNQTLQIEVEDLRQQLKDAHGDIKLLRQQIARQRVGSPDEGINTRHFPLHEREDLVKQIEGASEKNGQLQRDLQQVLDEKQDLETERDAYKNKYERLNKELNYILKGDENRIVDIDALSMDNKFLQERLKQMKEEKSLAMATVSKYKSLLERKKSKNPSSPSHVGNESTPGRGGVVSQKQVNTFLNSGSGLSVTQTTVNDLQGLASALLEALNDKNMALSHQRKANKLLGTRVSELEKKLRTLEVSGFWNLPGKNSGFDRLQELAVEMQTVKESVDASPMASVSDNSDLMQEITRDVAVQTDGCESVSPSAVISHIPDEPLSTNGINSLSDLDPFGKMTLVNNDNMSDTNTCNELGSELGQLYGTESLSEISHQTFMSIQGSHQTFMSIQGNDNLMPSINNDDSVKAALLQHESSTVQLKKVTRHSLVCLVDQPLHTDLENSIYSDPSSREFGVIFQQPELQEELIMDDLSNIQVVQGKSNYDRLETIKENMSSNHRSNLETVEHETTATMLVSKNIVPNDKVDTNSCEAAIRMKDMAIEMMVELNKEPHKNLKTENVDYDEDSDSLIELHPEDRPLVLDNELVENESKVDSNEQTEQCSNVVELGSPELEQFYKDGQ